MIHTYLASAKFVRKTYLLNKYTLFGLKREILSMEDLRSRKFMSNVLETRLARQKRESMKINSQAEKKIKNDPRLINILGTEVGRGSTAY